VWAWLLWLTGYAFLFFAVLTVWHTINRIRQYKRIRRHIAETAIRMLREE
jgi:hypothetical protein